MRNDNIIVLKSKDFALRIIRLYVFLTESKREYVLSKQILRCGTSIGANVKEAMRGQSKPDFYSKLKGTTKNLSHSESTESFPSFVTKNLRIGSTIRAIFCLD